MPYRLGLDLGTNSIGAVALSLDEQGQPEDIVWHRCHIFSEPLENAKGILVPKSQDRRIARQRRRQLQRRSRRLKKIAYLAPLLGVGSKTPPTNKKEQYQFYKGVKVSYIPYVRAKAATEKVSLEDLLKICLKLGKKRGYSGGFKAKSDDTDRGKVQQGAESLNTLLNNITLGQYLLERLAAGLPCKLKLNQNYEDSEDLFALREHLKAEFETIWKTQQKHHDVLKQNATCPESGETKPLKQIFYNAIFYQRPLKSFTASIGRCPVEPTLPRAPKAHPAAQAFRIETTIQNLRVGQGRQAKALSKEQKNIIRTLLNAQATVSYEKIYTALEKNGFDLEGKRFSINRTHGDSMKGNTTLAGFRSLKMLEVWEALDSLTQTQVINFWSEIGSPEQIDTPNWQEKFATQSGKATNKRSFSKAMVNFINQLLDTGKFDRLSKVNHFEGGRAAYSIKALKKLTNHMRENDCEQWISISSCYPNNNQENTVPLTNGCLSLPEKTGNAVVDVALRQLYNVLKECIENLNESPAEIVIEMSRDIKNSVTKRNALENENNKRQRYRKRLTEEILSRGAVPTPTNLRRYELAEQQDFKCPYCPENLSWSQALDGAETHFEHIIPRSISKVGLKNSEIVIAHRDCNNKKGNRLPLIAFAGRKERVDAIQSMSERLKKKKQARKAQLLLLDDEQGLLDDESVDGFSDWQHHDTSWLAKLTVQYLRQLPAQKVSVTRGRITAMLRKTLGLETVIPTLRYREGKTVLTSDGETLDINDFREYQAFYEGHKWNGDKSIYPPQIDKRIDHRHHLIDALTIALSPPSFVQRITKIYQQEVDKNNKGTSNNVVVKMKSILGSQLQYLAIQEKAIACLTSAHITHKTDHYSNGRFFQEGAYQRVTDEVTNKLRLVIRKPLRNLAVKGNSKKTRERLDSIVSDKVRAHIIKIFDQRVAEGLPPEEALNRPILQTWYGEPKPIFSVKTYYDRGAEKAQPVEFSGKRQAGKKYLIPDLYAYLSLFWDNNGDVDQNNSGLTTLFKANQYPKPPGKNEWRYHKGDTVVDQQTQQRMIIQKFKAIGGGTVFLAPLTETRTYDQMKKADGILSVGIKKLSRYKPEYISHV